MADKVRMAFVGVGWWSNMLAEAASRSERIKVAACCSRSEDKTAAFVQRFGGVARRAYEDILADRTIDAVVLTTPNSLHAPQAVAAAGNGKHVYVEKPMALTVAECKGMVAAAKAAGTVLMVGHNARRMARYRKAREFVEKGMVGNIVLAEANSSGELGMRLTPKTWRWYRSESPGGPLMSFTVHHADNLNHLVGPVKKVSAFIGKVCGPAEADDVVSATVQFECGALGYVGGSFLTPDRNFLQIHGTEGVVLVDEEGGSTSYQKKGTEVMVRSSLPDADAQRLASIREEMEEYARCIQTGTRPEVTGEVGLQALAVIEAIIRSAGSGRTVELEELL